MPFDYIEWNRIFRGAGCRSRNDYAKTAEQAVAHLDEDAIEQVVMDEIRMVMEAMLEDVDHVLKDMASRLSNEGEYVAATSLITACATIQRIYRTRCTIPSYEGCQCQICTAPGKAKHRYRIDDR